MSKHIIISLIIVICIQSIYSSIGNGGPPSRPPISLPPNHRPPFLPPHPHPHPVAPPQSPEPPVSPPVDHGSCPSEDTQYSTCCPSYQHEPYVHPQRCDSYSIDSRYIPGDCKYHEGTTGIPCETREYFMEMAMNFTFEDSGSACPAFPFGAIIVNHTAGPRIEDAEIIAVGKNKMIEWSSNIWHGEMVAIQEAGPILNQKFGRDVTFEADVWQQLSLYTTGEPCPMCAMAIRFSKFGEIIQSVDIPDLNLGGYTQPNIRVFDVQQKSNWCGFPGIGSTTSYQTRIVTDVLKDQILPIFLANVPGHPCPVGCHRPDENGPCVDI